jgi:hypothetical protein
VVAQPFARAGIVCAPGAPLSAAIYDKVLEERCSGKRWMEAIHSAGGWRVEVPLFRVEGRFMREFFREISAGMNLAAGEWRDDPWLALEHLNDFCAYFAGTPPEHVHAPDAMHRGWLRLTVPQVDSNRARWLTDPVWEIVRRAPFSDRAPLPLQRGKSVTHDLEQIDAELSGLFKLCSALCERHMDATLTLSLELRAFAERMDAAALERGCDYKNRSRTHLLSSGG